MTFPRALVCGFAAVWSVAAFAQTPTGVHNFHQINNHIYRGAQPTAAGFQNLAKLGVKTIIDLREGGERSLTEKKLVEAAGMRYVSVPLSGFSAPSPEKVAEVLALFENSDADPVFIHCRRGADRTGTLVACYRISHDHWNNDRALAEAKADGMSWTEIAMHHFVLHYHPSVPVVTQVAASATGTGN